jgi:hypothetical protein
MTRFHQPFNAEQLNAIVKIYNQLFTCLVIGQKRVSLSEAKVGYSLEWIRDVLHAIWEGEESILKQLAGIPELKRYTQNELMVACIADNEYPDVKPQRLKALLSADAIVLAKQSLQAKLIETYAPRGMETPPYFMRHKTCQLLAYLMPFATAGKFTTFEACQQATNLEAKHLLEVLDAMVRLENSFISVVLGCIRKDPSVVPQWYVRNSNVDVAALTRAVDSELKSWFVDPIDKVVEIHENIMSPRKRQKEVITPTHVEYFNNLLKRWLLEWDFPDAIINQIPANSNIKMNEDATLARIEWLVTKSIHVHMDHLPQYPTVIVNQGKISDTVRFFVNNGYTLVQQVEDAKINQFVREWPFLHQLTVKEA